MEKFVSEKLRILSFVAIVLVVYGHAFYIEGASFELNRFFQYFIGQGLCRICIPLFFAISGYLFFLSMRKGFNSILEKIGKRMKTLLFPYIIWNIWFVLVFMLLYFMPSFAGYVNNNVFEGLLGRSAGDVLLMVFWEPAGFHLWFLRNLFVIVLCTPVLYYLMKYIPGITTMTAILVCLVTRSSLEDYIFGLTWFSIGAYFAVTKRQMLSRAYRYSRIVGIICLVYFFVESICIGVDVYLPYFTHFLGMAAGTIGVWLLYDYVVSKPLAEMKFLNQICGYTFFIYLFHEPAFNVLKKLPPIVFGQTQWVYLVCYFVLPLLMILLALVVGIWINRFFPRFYSMIVGGR